MRKTVDWEAVELRYRTGTESLRSIAADFGITEGAIRQRAKKEEWTRDLAARVKQATEAKLLRKAATHDVRTEKEVIELEAETRVSIIVSHRTDIAKARKLTGELLVELETQAIGDKKPELAKRAPVLKQLSEALRIQIALERQAFGIVGEPADDPEHAANAANNPGRGLSDAERAVRLARLLATGATIPLPAGAPA